MSAVQHLRLFVTERLSAAAEEICGVFEKALLQYGDELRRRRDGPRDAPGGWAADPAGMWHSGPPAGGGGDR